MRERQTGGQAGLGKDRDAYRGSVLCGERGSPYCLSLPWMASLHMILSKGQ